MNPIRKLFRLRKQSDTAKLALLLLLTGAVFFARGIANVSALVASASAPLEYILQTGAPAAAVMRIGEDAEVQAVSLQRRFQIAVGDREAPQSLTVSEVSPAYLQAVFSIVKGTQTMETFYLNKAAFDLLFAPSAAQSRQAAYATDEKTGMALFVLCDAIRSEAPAAFHAGTAASLRDTNADSIRVLYRGADFSDARSKQLTDAGYTVENETVIYKAFYEKKLLLQTVFDTAVIIAIATVSGTALLHAAKKQKSV